MKRLCEVCRNQRALTSTANVYFSVTHSNPLPELDVTETLFFLTSLDRRRTDQHERTVLMPHAVFQITKCFPQVNVPESESENSIV